MSVADLIRRHRNRAGWLAVGLGVVLIAFLLRGPILAWLTGAHAHEDHSETAASPATAHLPSEILPELRASFDAYEEARALLAQDSIEGLEESAGKVAESLEAGAAALPDHAPELSHRLHRGIAVAEGLAASADLDEARERFAELSEFLISLASRDARLVADWHLFFCPMQEGFNQWFQRSAEIGNPYKGSAMPRCGATVDWPVSGGEHGDQESTVHDHPPGEISHYTCSMHPSVRAEEPGSCPICGMQLVAVTREQVETGVLFIDEQRRQRIGVRTGRVERQPARLTVRAVGEVEYDETRLADVSLKVSGWIVALEVDTTGQRVEKGETLFTLYSPELYAAQEEYLLALRSQREARQTGLPGRADYLVRAAKQRLRLWDLTDEQIQAIARRGKSVESLPILSPAEGFVIEKNVVEGGAIRAGDRLYRIAGLDAVWVNAQVYETELPIIVSGQAARVTLSYQPGQVFEGHVAYVYPYLDKSTRTGRVRIELENPQLELRPDMYANVEFAVELGERLMVPEEAVVYTGPRRLVFLDLGEGRLRPEEVEVGIRADEHYEILSGLREGDRVVTSGNFLVAAESRIRSATRYWGGGHDRH
jgi:Cu(I)/Ag(I) efflux system membrane fusion protein